MRLYNSKQKMKEIPKIEIEEEQLDSQGFTKSGKLRYIKTLEDYNSLLFQKALGYGDSDKLINENREVTHEHVRAASHSIAKSYGKPIKPNWFPWARFGQYLCTAFVGLSIKSLNEIWGLITFVITFCVGGILLFLTEKENNK